jgi:hypothetical protein
MREHVIIEAASMPRLRSRATPSPAVTTDATTPGLELSPNAAALVTLSTAATALRPPRSGPKGGADILKRKGASWETTAGKTIPFATSVPGDNGKGKNHVGDPGHDMNPYWRSEWLRIEECLQNSAEWDKAFELGGAAFLRFLTEIPKQRRVRRLASTTISLHTARTPAAAPPSCRSACRCRSRCTAPSAWTPRTPT